MHVKELWTDLDFSDMGWHDSRLYSLSIPDESFKLSFDVDYIFKWEKTEGLVTGFWVSPCDLIFLNVSDFKMDIDLSGSNLLFVSDIKRSNERYTPNGKFVQWDYEIECDSGSIYFSSTGYEQRIKKQPVLSETQDLNFAR